MVQPISARGKECASGIHPCVEKKGERWRKEHGLKDFFTASVGELVEWKLYAVGNRTDMVYIVFQDSAASDYMTDRKGMIRDSQIFTIDEVLNRTVRRLRLEKKYKARTIIDRESYRYMGCNGWRIQERRVTQDSSG